LKKKSKKIKSSFFIFFSLDLIITDLKNKISLIVVVGAVENVENSNKTIFINAYRVSSLWKTLWKKWLVFHRV